jgi:predicted transcriptional regulator
LHPEIFEECAEVIDSTEVVERSSNFLISDAVEAYVAGQERMLAETRQADRQVQSEHYIKQEDMKASLLSWGTEHELPPPKCVCRKDHDDEALYSTACGGSG